MSLPNSCIKVFENYWLDACYASAQQRAFPLPGQLRIMQSKQHGLLACICFYDINLCAPALTGDIE